MPLYNETDVSDHISSTLDINSEMWNEYGVGTSEDLLTKFTRNESQWLQIPLALESEFLYEG